MGEGSPLPGPRPPPPPGSPSRSGGNRRHPRAEPAWPQEGPTIPAARQHDAAAAPPKKRPAAERAEVSGVDRSVASEMRLFDLPELKLEPLAESSEPLDELLSNDWELEESSVAEPLGAVPRAGGASDVEPSGVAAATDSGGAAELTIAGTGMREADATVMTPPSVERAAVGKGTGTARVLRAPLTLPRRRGPVGDVAYVFTSTFGAARARRALRDVRRQLEAIRRERSEKLVELARQAAADASLTLPCLESAREQLGDIEERRSQRAGAMAAADAEIRAVRRERQEEAESHAKQRDARERELSELRERLMPLEKRAARIRRRAAVLGTHVATLDRKIGHVERGAAKKEPAAVQAELAALRAERQAVVADEPAIAAELDSLEPTIAGLTAARQEALEELGELAAAEVEGAEATRERIAAIEARNVVEARATARIDRERATALAELGEALCVERPEALAARMAAIGEREVTIATLERRALELDELARSVHRWAVVRGLVILLLLAAVIAAALLFLA